jgi:hypothetical protein
LSNSLNSTINQWGWDTYYLWEYKIIGEIKWWQKTIKFNHPRLISTISNPQAVITTDASPIAWGATSKFIPDFDFAQSNYVKSIKKGLMKDKPKNPRYSNIWNLDILLSYYQNINIELYDEKEKFQCLQTKIAVLLGFFHMLRPIEAWSSTIVQKPELKITSTRVVG